MNQSESCRLVISNAGNACLLITRAEVPDWLTNQIELCWLTWLGAKRKYSIQGGIMLVQETKIVWNRGKAYPLIKDGFKMLYKPLKFLLARRESVTTSLSQTVWKRERGACLPNFSCRWHDIPARVMQSSTCARWWAHQGACVTCIHLASPADSLRDSSRVPSLRATPCFSLF